jgi:hypothetical protein
LLAGRSLTSFGIGVSSRVARIIGTAGQMGNPLNAVNGRHAPLEC